jgi:rhodanese-related sulfurtransferase
VRPAHKRSVGGLYVTATEADAALQHDPGILLIDIRTHGETVFAGVAMPMHRHVPYIMLEGDHGYDADRRRYKPTPSPDFAKAIEQLFAEHKHVRSATVIFYCSTGERARCESRELSGADRLWRGVHHGRRARRRPDGKRAARQRLEAVRPALDSRAQPRAGLQEPQHVTPVTAPPHRAAAASGFSTVRT